MNVALEAASKIDLAWHDFITDGMNTDDSISPDIIGSWRRCYLAGVNPQDGRCYHFISQPELDELLDKKKYLIEIARPFMLNLYEFVKGSGFIVLLTDERGFVMEALGDNDTLEQAKTINFVIGADWTEESVGTNAIGTAIVLKKPIQTVGAEHYCLKHHSWTCSASPIFNKKGEMIGALDMSGPVKGAHQHTLGMVVAAVQAISDQMRIQEKNQELKRANNHLNEIFQTISDGVMIIDPQGVILQINTIAEQIIGKPARDLIGLSIKDVLGRGIPAIEQALNRYEAYSDAEVLVDTADGRVHCLSSGVPIIDDEGILTGAVILLRTMAKVQKLVNRFSGAQAVFHFKDVIGESQEMTEVIRVASSAAAGNANILLEGESGTGKEVIAQAIHNRSAHRKGPFVAVNCGAIPRELIGSELFGYSEGAFTGAKRGGRPGKFELASGGTLFLDEIGDMPLEQQVALLRVLQDKKITRIGDDKIIPVDFRIICATNKDLLQEVERGNFRQDLYYRVCVVSIAIPPLRSHPEDIPALFEHFMRVIGGVSRPQGIKVEPQVMEYLKQYKWPGNARELQNVVERLISMSEGGGIRVEHLPISILRPTMDRLLPSAVSPTAASTVQSEREKRRQMLAESEYQEIAALLSRHGGNISEVAQEMGVSRNTVYRKMRQYNIDL